MRHIKAIIFDCDGVLFESRRANLAYYNAVLEQFGEPLVQPHETERVHLCHTAATPQVLTSLLGEERAPEAIALAATLDYRQFIPCMDPEPGLAEALAALAENYPLAVATNRGFSALDLLEHFNLAPYFRVVVTSRHVPRPKPYPDMLILAAEKLGFSLKSLLFVGDSILDREAAERAGIRFASYKGDLGAEIALQSHAELVALMSKVR
ncbi:MAG: HAD family hydrolase [Desulfuromonadaceae bacterium]